MHLKDGSAAIELKHALPQLSANKVDTTVGLSCLMKAEADILHAMRGAHAQGMAKHMSIGPQQDNAISKITILAFCKGNTEILGCGAL